MIRIIYTGENNDEFIKKAVYLDRHNKIFV